MLVPRVAHVHVPQQRHHVDRQRAQVLGHEPEVEVLRQEDRRDKE
jgi:hypothetical protein